MSKPRIALDPFPSGEALLADGIHADGMNHAELVHELRKWTRLTRYTLVGLLTDMQGSMLNKEDVDLIAQLAAVADSYVQALEHLGIRAKAVA